MCELKSRGLGLLDAKIVFFTLNRTFHKLTEMHYANTRNNVVACREICGYRVCAQRCLELILLM